MQLLIKKCDRCGRIIEQKEYTGAESLTNVPPRDYLSSLEWDGKNHKQRNYDLCDDCMREFLYWMKNSTTVEEHLKKTLEKHEKLSRWSDEALAMARAHNESVEHDLSLSEKQEQPPTIPKIDKSKIKLKPGTHTYHVWTKEEDDFILHHSAGMTANDLACKFGVTVSALNSRRYNLLHGKV